jgi:hypothetical protein
LNCFFEFYESNPKTLGQDSPNPIVFARDWQFPMKTMLLRKLQQKILVNLALAWYAEFLIEIDLKILLRKTRGRLILKIALISLHVDPVNLSKIWLLKMLVTYPSINSFAALNYKNH